MTLLKYYKPEFEFSPVSNVLNELLKAQEKNNQYNLKPLINIAETEKYFLVSLTVPGINKSDIKIELNEDKLTVAGERKLFSDESAKYHQQQIVSGAFNEVFSLPKNVDKENINAKHEDGILSIQIQKLEKKEKKSIIEVK